MTVAGGSVLMGRVVAVSRSASVRGVEALEGPKQPLCAFGPSRASLSRSMVSSFSCRSLLQRGVHSHSGVARLDPNTTGAAMIANSAAFKRSAQLERYLNPRPWSGRRLVSTTPTAAAGSPSPVSFFVQLIEKIMQILAGLLPSKALVEKVEEEVDAAAAIIEQGAEIVSNIANKVEHFADAAEMGAEEVEKIAQKVEEVTKMIQTLVDDVADVLEGEKGFTTLKKSVQQLKNVAATKRAQESGDLAGPETSTGVEVAKDTLGGSSKI